MKFQQPFKNPSDLIALQCALKTAEPIRDNFMQYSSTPKSLTYDSSLDLTKLKAFQMTKGNS